MRISLLKLKSAIIHITLLCLLGLLIFGLPILPESWYNVVYSFTFTLLYIFSVLALKTYREFSFYFASTGLIVLWISRILDLQFLETISNIFTILFFGMVVIRFLFQIAQSKKADLGVIIESISGYLLLGVLFALLNIILINNVPGSVVFPNQVEPTVADIFYYTFVTISTLGYGDVLPVSDTSQSLAILISVSGQLYIAIVIAMLVGKYLSMRQSQQE